MTFSKITNLISIQLVHINHVTSAIIFKITTQQHNAKWLMGDNMSLPKIPEIKYVVSRPNPNAPIHDSEEFESYKEFERWAIDECGRELCDAYGDADPDSRRGCDGMREWVENTMWFNDLSEFVEEKGWKVSKVKV